MNRSTLTTRLSYTSSEIAGQLVFCVISFYLLKFYTDVYGISAVAAGTILLFSRFVDALDAPFWGIIFDRTTSRWGKSRPWFLWLSIPFAIFGVLTFVTPNLSSAGKVVYAAATYVFCSILYTGINTPVTSILASLTSDTNERIVLTSYRMFGSKFGVLVVNLSVLRLVGWLGHGNSRRGFALAMPVYALGTILLYLVAFRNLKETVHEDKHRLSLSDSFRAIRGNAPWFIIFLSSFTFWIAFIARISSAPYLFEYVVRRPELTSVANSLDVVSLGSILFLPLLCRRYCKRNVWATALVASALAQIVVHIGVSGNSTPTILGGWALGFLASGIAMALPFSVLADSVDYGEWKSGMRASGMLTAIGAAFCLKAGSGLGGTLPAWILAHSGYRPNVEQSSKAISGIEFSCIWLPAIAYTIAFLPVLFYRRYERMEPMIKSELAERRRLAALVSSSL